MGCALGPGFSSGNGMLTVNPFLFFLISFWLHCVFIALLGFSLAVASEGYSLVAVHMLLIAVACLVAEHEGGLQ